LYKTAISDELLFGETNYCGLVQPMTCFLGNY